MKKAVLIVLVAILALSGLGLSCNSVDDMVTPIPTPYVPSGNEPPEDATWLSPGKVQIGNFYPGARAEWPITIHNGNDEVAAFSVTYRFPDRITDGYVYPTLEVQDWVIVADPTPVMMPKETRDILVIVAMPTDATSPGRQWEFWISVKDTTQVGVVTTEICSRWLVSMR